MRASAVHRRRLAWVAVVAVASCVTAIDGPPPPNPVPILARLEPALVTAEFAEQTIVLIGHEFVEGAIATWNSEERATVAESEHRLSMTLEADDLAEPGSGVVRVLNPAPGGGTSADRILRIGTPIPRIDSIVPASAEAVVTTTLDLRVFGAGFTTHGAGSGVVFDGASVSTEVVSAGELSARIGDQLLARGRDASLTVVNPAPGGGSSAPVAFGITNPLPIATGLSPDSVRLGAAAEVRVDGIGFVPGMSAWLDGVRYEPVASGPEHVTFPVPSSALARGGGRVTVESPGPGGGVSNELVLGIQERVPELLGAVPPTLEVGTDAQPVRVLGRYFAPDATVAWNGTALSTTWVHADTLQITVAAADVASLGVAELSVHNPRGGGPSLPRDVGIAPPGRIAYGLVASGANGIYAARVTGADAVRLDPGVGSVLSMDAWPTGDSIVYARHPHIDPGLFIAAPGVAEMQISSEDTMVPRISGDGQWIYYQIGTVPAGEIWRSRADGSGAEVVVSQPPGFLHRWPAPSPSGTRLLYARYENALPAADRDSLHIYELGTGAITSLPVRAHASRWSPDESRIAYRDVFGNLRLISSDGTGDRAVIDRVTDFDWSPDGQMLVVLIDGELFVLVLDTGLVVPLSIGLDRAARPVRHVAWYKDPGSVP